MKKLAILALTTFAATAFAGQPVVTSSAKKTVVPPEPCFGETELQLDVFGAYQNFDGGLGNGWGGGIGLNYFFHRNLGVGVDAIVTDADEDLAWTFTASVIARYPLDLGGLCLAPYVKVQGGYQTDGDGDVFIGVGGGLEFRVTPRIGIFGEGSYNWSGDEEDFAQARVGLRFVF